MWGFAGSGLVRNNDKTLIQCQASEPGLRNGGYNEDRYAGSTRSG